MDWKQKEVCIHDLSNDLVPCDCRKIHIKGGRKLAGADGKSTAKGTSAEFSDYARDLPRNFSVCMI
jgi:hypothetical protein